MSWEEELLQRVETEQLEQFRSWFEAGDRNALILALRFCMKQRIVVPQWAAAGFLEATSRWYSLETKELGEAFGLAWPKGKHLGAARKRRRLLPMVYEMVTDAYRRGRPIDDQLFEDIAKELNSNRSDAKKLWQEARRIAHPLVFLPSRQGRKNG